MKPVTVALIALTGCASAAESSPKSIFIGHNNGGDVNKYIRQTSRYIQSGAHLTFRGKCKSACTYYLAVPKNRVCVKPGAKFMFHLAKPYSGKYYGAAYIKRKAKINDVVMKHVYPPEIATWITLKGGLTDKWLIMDAKQAWLLGYKKC